MAGKLFYADGQWNFYCDLCGRKQKSSEGVQTWDKFYVCKFHHEIRNPQDYLRGVMDNQTVPWARPGGELFTGPSCTLQGENAIPGYAVPGCAIPSYVNLAFLATVDS